MKVKNITNSGIKKARYIRSLMVLHGVEQSKLAKELGVSQTIASLVIHGHRKGTSRNGKKIAMVKNAIAERVGKRVEELWPDKTT